MLAEYVQTHAIRGACTCGRCIDAPKNPGEHQPLGHTIDLTFFKVAKDDSAIAKEFLDLAMQEYPHWLDGNEHSYIQMGADIGDQGLALMTIGLGGLLGVWEVLAPETIMPFLDDNMKMMMAQSGMVSIKTKEEAP